MKAFKLITIFLTCLFSSSFSYSQGLRLDSLPQSEINIPFQINLRPFYAMAEMNVDTVFTSPNYPNDWVQADCATRYKYYFKRSPLQMSANDNRLNLSFIGSYKIIGSTRACVSGAVITPWTPDCKCGFSEGDRKVNVGFTSTFNFQPNYILTTKIIRTEPQPLNKCTVCFWGQDITKTVMEGMKRELDLSKKAMEDSFSIINLRPYIQQAWNKLSDVYNIPSVGFFTLNPKRLHMDNIIAKKDFLNINIGIAATPTISFIKPSEPLTPVPSLTKLSTTDGFNVHLEAALQYDSFSTVLNGFLVNKRFELSEGIIKKHMIINQTTVSGDDKGNLLIKMDFGGSHKGTVFFVGKPVYDQEKKLIEVRDLNYELKTNSFLLKTAKWLFNKRIINELKKNTNFNLTSYYDTAATTLNSWLNKEWTKGIKGSGFISDLKLTTVSALPQHLLIRSNCVGKLNVQVTSIDLKF
ncbi:MAG: DUF4403 family protein [Chitinophagaceae bacterium]